MRIERYQELSKRTMPFKARPETIVQFNELLNNYSLGLVGEVLELHYLYSYEGAGSHEDIINEMGDVLHYCVGLLSCMRINVDPLEIKEGPLKMIYAAGDVTEHVKKYIYHGHELDHSRVAANIYGIIHEIKKGMGPAFDIVLDINIQKLKTRYENGFSSAASIARKDVQ